MQGKQLFRPVGVSRSQMSRRATSDAARSQNHPHRRPELSYTTDTRSRSRRSCRCDPLRAKDGQSHETSFSDYHDRKRIVYLPVCFKLEQEDECPLYDVSAADVVRIIGQPGIS
jgi:hypothetical protein